MPKAASPMCGSTPPLEQTRIAAKIALLVSFRARCRSREICHCEQTIHVRLPAARTGESSLAKSKRSAPSQAKTTVPAGPFARSRSVRWRRAFHLYSFAVGSYRAFVPSPVSTNDSEPCRQTVSWNHPDLSTFPFQFAAARVQSEDRVFADDGRRGSRAPLKPRSISPEYHHEPRPISLFPSQAWPPWAWFEPAPGAAVVLLAGKPITIIRFRRT